MGYKVIELGVDYSLLEKSWKNPWHRGG